ncbi:MAG: selenium cofactor biosynthesis protein YqeC [Aquisalimonadaceae bacterium]
MNETADSALLDALNAESGILCAVGAGGKKTTLYRLLTTHPGHVGMSATSFTYSFPDNLAAEVIVGSAEELLKRVPASSAQRIAYARPSDKKGRLAGLREEDIVAIHRNGRFDLTVLKADGARMRRIKCPDSHEPQIPGAARTVLLVLSIAAVGRPLDERVAHRPARVAEVTGLKPGETLVPAHLGVMFSHPQGLLKGTEGRTVIPVIHMVDGPGEEMAAREAAAQALAGSARFDRVVLTSAKRESYLVDVIRR